jgi:hypothetical protein
MILKKHTRNRKQETNNISNQRVVVHCETLSVPENGFWGETIVVTIVHGFQQLHRHRCTMQPQQPGWRGWFIVVFGFQRVFKQSLHVVHPVENNNKTNDHKRKANNNNKTRRCVQCTGGVVASIRRMCVATFFTHSSHILHTFFTHSSHILHTLSTVPIPFSPIRFVLFGLFLHPTQRVVLYLIVQQRFTDFHVTKRHQRATGAHLEREQKDTERDQ